ncbi:hypothetical protein D9757_002300 [Collybiopsis confluens]|uniref:Uncharacterized protein n=1 Tax=Collybiopsis confluens TaxID=2823264 RepID=A0A8H5HZM3_9AGAR|nr:hypothetical protein D9757_002300 [Collybiopsis confluens]
MNEPYMMPADIFLEYLINSTSSMGIYLDEDMLTELEDSWRWRHITPGFFESNEDNEFILDWTKDVLAEPEVGIHELEFNAVCLLLNMIYLIVDYLRKSLALAIKSDVFLANIRASNRQCKPEDIQHRTLFGLEYVLLSGKVGDPEEFLDMNVLPNFDAIKLLYHDCITILFYVHIDEISTELHDSPRSASFSTTTKGEPKSITKRHVHITKHLTCAKRRKRDSDSIEMSGSSQPDGSKALLEDDKDKSKTDIPPPVLQEFEIQRLVKILEETLERVEDSDETVVEHRKTELAPIESRFDSQISLGILASPLEIAQALAYSRSFESTSSSSLYSASNMSRCSSTSSTSTTSSTSSSGTSISRCSSESSIPSTPSLAPITPAECYNKPSIKNECCLQCSVSSSNREICAHNCNPPTWSLFDFA